MKTEQQKAAIKANVERKSTIRLVEVLKGSDYEDVAERLAEQLDKVGIYHPDQITNAPIRLKVTYGVDVQVVVELVQAYYEKTPEPTPKAKVKKSVK